MLKKHTYTQKQQTQREIKYESTGFALSDISVISKTNGSTEKERWTDRKRAREREMAVIHPFMFHY